MRRGEAGKWGGRMKRMGRGGCGRGWSKKGTVILVKDIVGGDA